MTSTPAPFAALTAGLLARKGEARPAMRRRSTDVQDPEDLGWNDLGAPETPPVLAQRAALAERIAGDGFASLEAARLIQRDMADKPRAAFTLRLDPARHLRLRLASALSNRSAQQLLTEALDAFLRADPQVEQLARQAEIDGDGTDREERP